MEEKEEEKEEKTPPSPKPPPPQQREKTFKRGLSGPRSELLLRGNRKGKVTSSQPLPPKKKKKTALQIVVVSHKDVLSSEVSPSHEELRDLFFSTD